MSNNGWISVKDKLPESHQDVLIYWYDKPSDLHIMDLLVYFKKGDLVDWETRAPEDGFYIYEAKDEADGYRRHADIITHWQPLPEPPGRAGK